MDELQEYCKIDVKSLEIVFLLSQNNYFALLTTPIMKLLSLFLLILLLFSENTFSQKLLLP
jgi:hypothetical protein